MPTFRTASFCSALLWVILAAGCTPAGEVANSSKSGGNYPGWYNVGTSIVAEGESFFGYASALSGDSLQAGRQAVSRAVARLESEISDRMESARSEAAVERGSASGLDSPQFILALRKVERVVSTVAEPSEIEVFTNEEAEGYRGFAEVRIDRDEVIEAFDRLFFTHQNTWQALKESEAFTRF